MEISFTCRLLAIWLAFLLHFPASSGISWLALSSSRPPEAWNSSSHSPEAACAEARRLGLLSSRRQERACSAWPWPGSLALASDAARLAVSACLEAFADRRWNCSSLLAAPRLTPDLTVGTREQAFVYALSSASLTQSWARACSQGRVQGCGCGPQPRKRARSFKWGGCADNVRSGARLARTFTDPPATAGSFEALVNRHNCRAGRQAVREGLSTHCKCHGVSGACNVKTCWRGMAPLSQLATTLRRRYQAAVEVRPPHLPEYAAPRRGSRRAAPLLLQPASPGRPRPDKTDLVFRTKSPDYCARDARLGSPGTAGRRCNSSVAWTGRSVSCESMCCGRGFETRRQRVSERCRCRYHWCCFVECDTCHRWTQLQLCK
ncbi:protein Wnt-11-like isoform X2 [Haemaphysalis longicornis]